MNASQKEQNSKRLLGNLLLILTAMIWGCAFVAQRSGMEHIEPLTFNAARLVLASAAVGTLALVTGRRKAAAQPDRTAEQVREERRATVLGGICCGCFMAAASALQQMGLVYTEAGKAGFITALYMLLVPVLSFLLFRKKHSVQVWIAVAIGLVGLYLLCMAESLRLNRGDALICLCALRHYAAAGLSDRGTDLGESCVGCRPHPLLRPLLQRHWPYAADRGAEIYRAYGRIPADEPGVGVCGAGRGTAPRRTHERQGTAGLRHYVRGNCAGSDPAAEKETRMK